MNYNFFYFRKCKIAYILILFHISYFLIYAQSNDTLEFKDKSELVFDSLLAIINSTPIDTMKVNMLNEIAWEFAPTNFEKSMLFSDSARALAKEIGWEKGEAIAIKNAGEALRYNGKVEESVLNFEKCLPIFKRLEDHNEIARVYNHLGLSYRYQSKFEKSYKYYDQALRIYEDLDDIDGKIKGLTYLGSLFLKFDNYSKSLDHYKKALVIAEQKEKNSTYANIITNIGMIYSKQKKYKEALSYYQEASMLFKSLNNLRYYSQNLGNIGDLYSKQQKYSKALIYSKKALFYVKKINEKSGIAYQSANLGEIQYKYAISDQVMSKKEKSQLLASSIKNYNESIKLFVELQNKVEQSNELKSLSKVYQETRNFELALSCLEKANKIDDILQISNVKQAIADAEHKKDIDLKKKEIAILNAENEYNKLVIAISLTVALLLIISVVYFYHQYLSIKHHSKLLEENNRFRSQSIAAFQKNEQELNNHKFQLEMVVNKRISKLESELNERKLTEEHILEVLKKAETINETNEELNIIPKKS